MQIGATSLGWHGTPLPDTLKQLREFGGECVELTSRVDGHAGFGLERATVGLARELAENFGLTISSVGGYNDFAQTEDEALEREIQKLVHVCELAAELEVGIVRAFVADKPSDAASELYPQIIRGFQQAAARAQPLGVTLAIENHGRFWNDADALVRLIHAVDASNVGLTLDTGNFCWAGHSAAQFASDWKTVLPHVRNVHVKDGVWHTNGEFEFVPAGQGETEIVLILTELAAQGYQGAVCSEYEGAGNFSQGTSASIAYLQGVRDGLARSKQKSCAGSGLAGSSPSLSK